MIKVYISGQISGLIRDDAAKNFECAEKYLISLGFEVINPMKLNPYNPDWSWQQYMVEDIRELFECDAIFLLDNAMNSRGARIELRIASEMNLIIFSKKVSGNKSFLVNHLLSKDCVLYSGTRFIDSDEITKFIESHQRENAHQIQVIRTQGVGGIF